MWCVISMPIYQRIFVNHILERVLQQNTYRRRRRRYFQWCRTDNVDVECRLRDIFGIRTPVFFCKCQPVSSITPFDQHDTRTANYRQSLSTEVMSTSCRPAAPKDSLKSTTLLCPLCSRRAYTPISRLAASCSLSVLEVSVLRTQCRDWYWFVWPIVGTRFSVYRWMM